MHCTSSDWLKSPLIWEWIADYNCHKVLCDPKKLDKMEDFMKLLRNANKSLHYSDLILKNIKSNLESCDLDDLTIRTLLTCLLIQAFFSVEESIGSITFLNEELPPLQSILKLIDCMKCGFSEAKQDLLNKLWVTVFKELIRTQISAKSCTKKSLHDIAAKYGKNIPKSAQSVLVASGYKLKASELQTNNQEYLKFFLDTLYKLHSDLEVPFLTKVEKKLMAASPKNKCNDAKIAALNKSACDHVYSQLLLLKKLDAINRQQNNQISLSENDHAENELIDVMNASTTSTENDDSSKDSSHTKSEIFNIIYAVLPKENQPVVKGNQSGGIPENSHEQEPQLESCGKCSSLESDTSINLEAIPCSSTPVQNNALVQENSCSKDRVWSLQHDAYLIAGVEKFGEGMWNKIKQTFPFPLLDTNNDIGKRWKSLLERRTVEIYPDRTIKRISPRYNSQLRIAQKMVTSSTGIASRAKRVNESLHGQDILVDKVFLKFADCPDRPKPIFAGKRAWSIEEDACIILGVSEYGRSWSRILSQYTFAPKRTGVHLKDRWRTLIAKKLVTLDKNEKVVGMSTEHKNAFDKLKEKNNDITD